MTGSELTQKQLVALLAANQAVIADLTLPTLHLRVVEAARTLMAAQSGAFAFASLDDTGEVAFVPSGMDAAEAQRFGQLLERDGLLAALERDLRPLRLDRHGLLASPVRVDEELLGHLFLTNAAEGHFGDDDEVLLAMLAATAAVALHHAQSLNQSRRRQEWLRATADVTTQVLTVSDDAALRMLVEKVRLLSAADLATVVIPDSTGSELTVTAASGLAAEALLHQRFPVRGTVTADVLESGRSLLVHDAAEREVNGPYLPHDLSLGPAMVLPLVGRHHARGALISCRLRGRRGFTDVDLEMGTTFATHASLALELADARRDQQRMVVLEDRTRIARDLHDHVIQQLFAAGMTAQSAAAGLQDASRTQLLDRVVDTVHEAIQQIRTSIFQLQPHAPTASSLRAAVLEVVAEVTPALGFKPQVSFEGPVDAVSDEELAEDVVAVVRELLCNTAKHAQARSAKVHLGASGTTMEMRVTDDGVGLGTTRRRSGLANLRERAEHRRGTLRIGAPPADGGTTIAWSVPLG